MGTAKIRNGAVTAPLINPTGLTVPTATTANALAGIQVVPGTTVTWTNHDNFTHTVQVEGQSEVHSMRPGETAQITFTNPGTYSYLCTLHTQNMKGTVQVS